MPSGYCALMDMTDMTDWTDEDLEKEFADTEEDHQGEEEEEERVGESGDQRGGSAGRTSLSDRRSSAGSVTTTPDMQPGEDGKDGAMADSGGKKRKNSAQAVWQTVKKAGAEINQDTRKVFRFIGRKLHSRHGPRETKVKEIHILPGEEDDTMWARRIAGSAHSQSSSGSDPST